MSGRDPLAASLLDALLAMDDADLAPLVARLDALRPPPPPPEPSPYLTVPEVAALLRCRRQRVDDLLSRGTLPRVKDGRRTLVPRRAVEDYLAGGGR